MPVRDPVKIIDRRALRAEGFPIAGTVERVKELNARLSKELEARGLEGYRLPPDEVIAGQVSNTRAWLYNESRKAKETVIDITSGPVQRGELMEWLSGPGLRGNRNVFDLSIRTHVRAVGRTSVWNLIEATQGTPNPVSHVGVIVPPQVRGSIRPRGTLQRYVGRIFDVQRWMNIGREQNRGRRSLSLSFTLGLHHGDPHQLLPITGSKLAAVTAAMRAYRARFVERLRREEEP